MSWSSTLDLHYQSWEIEMFNCYIFYGSNQFAAAKEENVDILMKGLKEIQKHALSDKEPGELIS